MFLSVNSSLSLSLSLSIYIYIYIYIYWWEYRDKYEVAQLTRAAEYTEYIYAEG